MELGGFLDKRRASGDASPRATHDMTPLYEKVFGLGKNDLEDEIFLMRLRRNPLDGPLVDKGSAK